MASKLTDQQRRMIDHFMRYGNKRQAMLDAGYSESMAKTGQPSVFNNPAVRAEITRRQKLATHRSDVSLDKLIGILMEIADANVGDMIDVYSDGSAQLNFKKLNPSLQKALKKFTVKEVRGKPVAVVEFDDRLRAIEMVIRHLGLSKEKQTIELSGEASLVEALNAGRSRAGQTDEEDNG